MKQAIGAIVLSTAIFGAGAVQADDVRVGTVDMRRVLTESKAGKQIKNELEKTVQQRKQGLAREEQQLKNLQQAFEKDKLLLSDAQKQTKQKEFEGKLRAYQQSAAQAQREINKKESDYAQKALPEVRAIIHAVAKEEKLTLVLEKQNPQLLYVDGPDITDKVIKRFDAK